MQNDIKAKSITPDASTAKPVEIAPEKLPTMNAPAMPTKIEANNPVNGIFNPNAARMAIPQVETPEAFNAKAVSTGAAPTATNVTEEKALTPWEQMLANQRKQYEQDKTDAVKMQKYYALTDALNAIGKMGGAAIGGAIGGDVLGGAPNVGEYKESRGYLDAFERAKQANDRLRALDEKEFTLAYNKAQRDEERAHQAKMKEDERAYNFEMDKLNKQWQKDMIDYKAKIEQAALENNLALKAKYEAELAAINQKYWEERAATEHKYNMAEKRLGQDIVKMQMGGGNRAFTLNDGTVANIPSDVFAEMKAFYADKGSIDGTYVDAENIESFLRTRPDLVADFVSKHGVDYKTNFVAPEYKTEAEIEAEQDAKDEEQRKGRREHRKQNRNLSSPTVGNVNISNASSASNQSISEYDSKFKRN